MSDSNDLKYNVIAYICVVCLIAIYSCHYTIKYRCPHNVMELENLL